MKSSGLLTFLKMSVGGAMVTDEQRKAWWGQ